MATLMILLLGLVLILALLWATTSFKFAKGLGDWILKKLNEWRMK